jgi:diguanylate cyclase (GGDEF)-like protein
MRTGRCLQLSFGVFALLWATFAWASAPMPSLEDIGFLPAERYDLGDGLPDLSVVSAAVTPQGQVWLGTMRGLVRYNGRRFMPEPGPHDALAQAIGDVAATPDGRVWVSLPERGAFVREDGAWRDVGAVAGLPDEGGLRLRAFGNSKDYRLFAAGRGSLREWDGRRWQPRELPESLAKVEIFDVLLQAGETRDEDLLWVASFGRGLWRCLGRQACQPVPMTAPGPRFNEITSLEHWTDPKDGSPILWVASYGGGLARLQHGQWQRMLAGENGLPSNFLQKLLAQSLPGQVQHLWVGTRSGVAHRVGEHWLPLASETRLDGATVKALAAGRTAGGEPLVWIGSDQGAARLRLTGPWLIVSQTGGKGNGVWAVLHEQSKDGEQIWIGSDGDGLLNYSAAGWKQYRVADGLPTDMVRSVVRDPSDGSLLIGTWGGELSRFDGKRFRTLPTPWPKSDHEAISVILPDRDGSIWYLLREAGLAHWQAGTWTRYRPEDGYPTRIYDLQRVGDVLWGSTNTRGLARIDPSGWKYFGRADGLPDDSYYGLSLVTQSDGRPVLWAGSFRAGVVRVDVSDPSHPRNVISPALPTLPDPFVYEVVPDGRGNMFLASNYGASLWRPRAAGGYSATDFHRADGLPHDEANYGALQVDAQRRIWLGTLGGLAVFTPRPARAVTPAPLVLENLSIDNQPVTEARLTRPLALPLGHHDLRFEMALRTGERENGIRYRSQMFGLEDAPTAWSADNQRSFTALPAGDYMLRLEARDADGVAPEPIELSLSIPLPGWRTGSAFLGLCLAAVIGLYGLLHLREKQQRQRERHLVDLVRQRTSELELRGLELRRINEELTRLSYHDPLTDLANRRMLLERLHGAWDLAQARGSSLAFVLFDLDQFKAYNDQRGHLAGDDCLREIGRRIDAELTRPDDTAGRYGGEEFGVVLPGLNLAAAMQVAERIRHAVEAAGLAHPSTPQGVVTISVGVAAMIPRAGFSAEVLIAAADAALYRAKAGGKNRVEAAG